MYVASNGNQHLQKYCKISMSCQISKCYLAKAEVKPNPIAVRRRKLMAKIDELIQLATNKDFTPTQLVNTIDF